MNFFPSFPKPSSSLMPLPERRDKVKLILIYRSSKEECLILKAFFAISPFEILEILSLRSIVSCANFELLQLDGDYCLVGNHLQYLVNINTVKSKYNAHFYFKNQGFSFSIVKCEENIWVTTCDVALRIMENICRLKHAYSIFSM